MRLNILIILVLLTTSCAGLPTRSAYPIYDDSRQGLINGLIDVHRRNAVLEERMRILKEKTNGKRGMYDKDK